MIAALVALIVATSPLIEAVKQHDTAAVRELLKKRADVNLPAGDGATALHWAVYGDDMALIDLLIAAGARVDVANDLAITPLHLASAAGNAAIVTRLLEKSANPNAASKTGVTPLMEAARSGSVEAVDALLGRGAHVNAQERGRDQTALMWAVARRHPEVVRLLLQHGADVHARTRARPLTVMLDQGPRRTVKTSMQDARQIEAGGSTALIFAAEVGDARSAAHLLAAGANVNDAAADGASALVRAAFAGHADVARVLIDGGADVNSAGAGYSALHAAALRGDLATTHALLVNGADPDVRLSRGSPVRRFGSQWALPTPLTGGTPLLVAATYLEVEIIRALLQARADPRVGLVNGGTTPLLAAAGVAVEKEARPSDLARWHIVDSDTPSVPRDETDVRAATALLLDAGADVNQSNESGDTALHAAASAGLPTVIQLLADRGASLDVKNALGQTPLALAVPRGRPDGRSPSGAGHAAAEALLRKLGATQ